MAQQPKQELGLQELSDIVMEADSLFDKVENNEATPEEIIRLLQQDSSIVDSVNSLSPSDSRPLPNHIKSVIEYFRNGEGLSSCYTSNLAAAIYFCIVDIGDNHTGYSPNSIESVEQHLRRFSGNDSIVEEVNHKQGGAQFLMDNKQDKMDSKYLIYNREFSDQYIYEFIIAERTRDLKTNYTIFADVFIVVRKRDGSDIATYTTSYYAELPPHLLGLNGHLGEKLRKFIHSPPTLFNSGTIEQLTSEYGSDPKSGVRRYDRMMHPNLQHTSDPPS